MMEYFKRNNGKRIIERISKGFYEVIVEENKNYIYNNNPDELFNESIAECL